MLVPLILVVALAIVSNAQQMEVWLTDPDANILFQQQPSLSYSYIDKQDSSETVIDVDAAEKYQTIDGFGYTLTGGSAMHLQNLDGNTRAALLQELFSIDKNNIGVSYLRLSIGASDLDEQVFSYDDLTGDETDPNMSRFNLSIDHLYLIPVLKQILTINPQIKLMGSPWSPPVWMKTNRNSVGGSLLTKYYDAYALYFVRYIEEMKKEGIIIDAITIQNEPLHPGNNPSLLMQAADQAQFIKQSLGPAFRRYSINTKIIVYDHNADRPDYPLTVLQDSDARQYVDGSAFHLYGGQIEALSQVHNAYPDKHLYFTEQWVGAPGNLKGDLSWHVKNLIIGATRNWARTVLEWNLAADRQLKPHTPGGCSQCLGALTIDGNQVLSPRNPAYYIIAHAAKFVRPNAVRIGSNVVSGGLWNVAFQRAEDQRKVLIVLNENDQEKKTFQIRSDDKVFVTTLNGGGVATYVW